MRIPFGVLQLVLSDDPCVDQEDMNEVYTIREINTGSHQGQTPEKVNDNAYVISTTTSLSQPSLLPAFGLSSTSVKSTAHTLLELPSGSTAQPVPCSTGPRTLSHHTRQEHYRQSDT